MKTTLKKRLLDALNACRAIHSFLGSSTLAEYKQDQMMRSAVERQFEIIGEALRLAEVEEPALPKLIPDVRRIIGLRNRIIHGYDSVDDELLWQTIQGHVPPLERRLVELLTVDADQGV
jgi:uncharacterized protein with HEPN domain